jgi:hypothetical protein
MIEGCEDNIVAKLNSRTLVLLIATTAFTKPKVNSRFILIAQILPNCCQALLVT